MDIKKSDYTLYNPSDKDKFWTMLRSEFLQWQLNKTPLWNIPKRNWLLKRILGSIDGKPYSVISPFHVQQGNNTHIGKNFFANYNCCILDHLDVYIGDNVLIAPNVSILSVSHPLLAKERIVHSMQNCFEPLGRGNWEVDRPVRIGNNVWLATGCVICPGVTIGDNSVIGANSVVTKDIPPNVLAYGVPCRVIREISESDYIGVEKWEEKQNV